MNREMEPLMGTIATKGMGGGAMTSILGFMLTNEALLLTGIVVTIAGFVVNFIVRTHEDKRQEAQWLLIKSHAEAEEERRQEIHKLTVAKLKGDTCE